MASITDPRSTDIADMLAPSGRPVQDLPGFDDEFVDIVDFIIRITHRIWEQKRLDLIRRHYHPDAPIRTQMGAVAGVEAVVANTLQTLGTFPDRCLIGDAVIWRDEGEGRYYTSHRIVSHMTERGAVPGRAPSHRRATVLTIADCLNARNQIVDEWLVRDTGALYRQIGIAPSAVARQTAVTPAARQAWQDMIQAVDAASPEVAESGAGMVDRVFTAINARDFDTVRAAHWPHAEKIAPPGQSWFGHGGVIGSYLQFLASFPDGRFRVDHVAVCDWDDRQEIAVRWTFSGHHSGALADLAPTGRRIGLMGVTHWTVIDGGISEDYTVYDMVGLMAQCLGAEEGG